MIKAASKTRRAREGKVQKQLPEGNRPAQLEPVYAEYPSGTDGRTMIKVLIGYRSGPDGDVQNNLSLMHRERH